ncbi:MAG: DNA transporter [Ignavibacteria bacterium GWB2_35_12]|nr:MAG: DNA transporter [Ignavibacteria bacterium GWB2_35_12]OGU89485.1 MAG: DNA transporter [Ignavibacteria bacterium RIFOXYA2_FULL_35_10]OGV21194.1 MAG: DNA transporter [Ignavibacteria bacterium RIFOXYC2_FULL_35_21]
MSEIPYWIGLTQLKGWNIEKINKLIISVLHENKLSLEEFFNLSITEWSEKFLLQGNDIVALLNLKIEIPNFSFLTEELLLQGFEIITINSEDYSATLKSNLKLKHSPPVLYVKGNKKILNEKSIAIVGSRNASEVSLKFTDNIAKMASEQFKVVVSGFAKGVDRQALDSAIKYIGHSVIVLPQGVLTFASGIRQYYNEIVRGDLLVLSTFFPKAPWSVQLAMARNPIIYGLADEIYVAQSDEKGGTWAGVTDGLRKDRTIYVRYPERGELNANLKLIQKGAKAVDFDGNLIEEPLKDVAPADKDEEIKTRVYDLLKDKELSSVEIIKRTNIEWSARKMTDFLKSLNDIKTIKGKPIKFRYKFSEEPQLFVSEPQEIYEK